MGVQTVMAAPLMSLGHCQVARLDRRTAGWPQICRVALRQRGQDV